MRLLPKIRSARAGVALSLLTAALSSGCGAAGSQDWYYHWSCNGDGACLGLNPTGAPSGTSNKGPELVNCTQLQQFSSRFWNMPPATDSCDHSSATPPSPLVSISIEPANPTIPVGLRQQFAATGHRADGTTVDLTGQVRWDASLLGVLGGTPIATITSGGLLTASAVGSNTLVADLPPLRGTTTVRVVAAAVQTITVEPANPAIPDGTTQRFTATGHLSDGTTQDVTSQCTWSSLDTGIATIDLTGLATAQAQGRTDVACTRAGLTGSTGLTVGPPLLVSISVTPVAPSVPVTYAAQLQAYGTYSDGSVQDLTAVATWSSGTAAVASVDPAGLATGLAAGTSAISASSGGVSGATTLTVSSATLTSVTVDPADPIIGVLDHLTFTAVGHFSDGSSRPLVSGVAWGSSATAVATIDAAGRAAGVALGTTTVTATAGGLPGTTGLTVSSTPPGVAWSYVPSSPVMNCSNGCAFVNFRLSGITWAGSQFVAVANNGGIFTSPDGIAWAARAPVPDASGVGSQLWGVAWSPPLSRLVAVGAGYVMTSSDAGVTWTPNSAAPISGRVLDGVIWAGTQFVAVGEAGAILTSPDGLTWTARTSGTTSALRAVTWTGTRYVVVGDSTLTSPDAVAWTRVTDSAWGLSGIAWSGNLFVQVGSSGLNRTSPDGITWATGVKLPTYLNGVIWTGNQFVAVGGPGAVGSPAYVFTSPDGATWTSRTVAPVGGTYTLLAVAWSGASLVAVGDHYYVYVSP